MKVTLSFIIDLNESSMSDLSSFALEEGGVAGLLRTNTQQSTKATIDIIREIKLIVEILSKEYYSV